jgi:hypothetical protein
VHRIVNAGPAFFGPPGQAADDVGNT